MTSQQKIAVGFFVVLLGAASLNYIPGVTDADGVAFGVFALDIFDDALHLASAIWALVAGLMSRHAARQFLLIFGTLYFGDGFLGLITGSGYLDFGIFNYGFQNLPFGFKILANLPHIGLGGIALASGMFVGRSR
ncbi:hypothetical protein [Boseongicola aestuarii]|uniref:DUF4383 domain-containing protein n=1 Tax=Boseongicola aestuarii TaxID=1470561 RepID=A0A238IX04_9RHOB|nr:hypothetical protein [Boseongicola aestuarii]SMX22936.1 hypothetical protein BOA8489_01035 [Boseongicola aestuarii]